jgi:flagellin
MAIRINYNPMSVLTNANLSRTDRQMQRVLDRLSSGERLTSSSEDPAALVVANAVRYYRTGIERAGSNAEEAVTMLQTAEAAMDQIGQTLQKMRTLALSALSTATQDPQQLAALQVDFDAAVRSITTMATASTFGTNRLLDGTLRDSALSSAAREAYSAFATDWRQLPGGIQDGSELTFTPDPLGVFPAGDWTAGDPLTRQQAVWSEGAGLPSTALSALGGQTITVTGPKGSADVAIPGGATIASAVAALNAVGASTGVIAAYDEASGTITAESTAYGPSTLALSGFADVVPAPTAKSITMTWIDEQGVPQFVTLHQDPASPDGLTFTNLDGGPGPGPDFDGFKPGAFSLTLRTPDDAGAIGSSIAPPDAGLTATRTSTAGFQVGALSSQRVTVEIPDLRAGALGAGAGLAASGFASLEDLLAETGVYAGALAAGDASSALALVDAALDQVNRARGAAGALQGNTVERVMGSLRESSLNLRDYEGILRDTDMAAESAQYARIQVMLQAATAMLAQANQVPQTVLQLLR